MTQLTTNTRTPSEMQTLDRLVAEVVSRLEAGESVDVYRIAADYPHLVEPL